MSRDALVVGINTYEHFKPLTSPAEDAEAIAQLLRASVLLPLLVSLRSLMKGLVVISLPPKIKSDGTIMTDD
jgi:hypothetical protein